MKWLAGSVGVILGLLILLFATRLASLYPPSITDSFARLTILLILLAFSFLEIPVMIFGLRQIARTKNTKLFALVTMAFTSFGAVYGAICVLLTQQSEGATALATLMVVRLIPLIGAK